MLKVQAKPVRRRAVALAVIASSAIAYAAIAGTGTAAPQAPPVNTQEPSIDGQARVGQVLQGDRGDWTNAQSFALRWMRCDRERWSPGCVGLRSDLAGDRHELPGPCRGSRLPAPLPGHGLERRRLDGRGVESDVPRPAGGRCAAQHARGRRSRGDPQVGESLTANDGTWTNNPTSFAYQWQRCDVDAIVCGNVPGATGKSYGVRAADVGFRVRVEVTARNASGTGTATSAATGIVVPRTPITNTRPTIGIISIRFTGDRVYARVRICDDQPQNLGILVTETKRNVAPANRRFSTRAAPRPCGAYTRSWIKPVRFRTAPGRYTISIRARDSAGNTSRTARRSFPR